MATRRDVLKGGAAIGTAALAATRLRIAEGLILPGGSAVSAVAAFSFTVGNSGGVTPGDGNSPPTYQDQMQNSRGFMTTADLTVHAALDASGWPTTDFQ